MKLKNSIKTHKGTIIPAGTKLEIGYEGFGFYNGETIFAKHIPEAALESDTVSDERGANNSYNSEDKWKKFEELEAGDKGYDDMGMPVTFLGKATGAAGYDKLVDEFGNASDLDFEDLTNGYDEDELADLKFVAYTSDEDGAVFVTMYGQDFATATEADSVAIPFTKVEPGDTGISKDGKAFKVYATGSGRVWFENTKEAQDLEIDFPAVPEGVDEDSVNFVYGAFENGPKSIELYGSLGVRVMQ